MMSFNMHEEYTVHRDSDDVEIDRGFLMGAYLLAINPPETDNVVYMIRSLSDNTVRHHIEGVIHIKSIKQRDSMNPVENS